jgi:hypothetical protein
MKLDFLHSGIAIPEYNTEIPWLITCDQICEYIPLESFRTPTCFGFPILHFTCLGLTADFGLNFVTHPEGKFAEVQLFSLDSKPAREKFKEVSSTIATTLGPPDEDLRTLRRWFDDRIVIDCCYGRHREVEGGKWTRYFELSICYSLGLPMHWNNQEFKWKH